MLDFGSVRSQQNLTVNCENDLFFPFLSLAN